MKQRTQATLATLGLLAILLAVLAFAGAVATPFGLGLAAALGLLAAGCVRELSTGPQRPASAINGPSSLIQTRPAGPGWYWNRALSKWTLHPKHATDPPVEDTIDAAVAAWKHVYGEDIGYNEHAVTLEWLRSLHSANALSSEQLADCADSVEWITWALKQAPGGGKRPARQCKCQPSGGPSCALCFPTLTCGCSETSANPNCRHVRRRKLAEPKWCGCHGECAHDRGLSVIKCGCEACVGKRSLQATYQAQVERYTKLDSNDAPGKMLMLEPEPCRPGGASAPVIGGLHPTYSLL